MRIAALALACLSGAAAATSAVGEDKPTPTLPPIAAAAPASSEKTLLPAVVPSSASSAPSTDVRAYAPSRAREIARPPRGRVCFSQAETREKIAQRRLTDPVSATRAGRAEGDALRTRLCRWKQDELVYEVYVLRRDGHIVRLYINAQNGQAVSAAEMADHK